MIFPFALGRRIDAEVPSLLALCDRLESALATTDTTRRKLIHALPHKALSYNAEAAS